MSFANADEIRLNDAAHPAWMAPEMSVREVGRKYRTYGQVAYRFSIAIVEPTLWVQEGSEHFLVMMKLDQWDIFCFKAGTSARGSKAARTGLAPTRPPELKISRIGELAKVCRADSARNMPRIASFATAGQK